MTASQILRAARRRSGLSQRALAQRAGVAPSQVAQIESGRTQPRVETLERLLASVGLELAVVPQRTAVDDELRDWLTRSLTERLRLTIGGTEAEAVLRAVRALGRGPFVLPVELGTGLWIPGVRAAVPLPVLVPSGTPVHPGHPSVRVTPGPWRVDGMVPVGVGPRTVVLVLPPDAPALAEHPELGARLRSVAALLHEELRSDAAQRRKPAHRDSDPVREEWWLVHRPQYDRLNELPRLTRQRDWRLDGEASLREWLARRGQAL